MLDHPISLGINYPMQAELKSSQETSDYKIIITDVKQLVKKKEPQSTGGLKKKLYKKEDRWDRERAELLKRLEKTREKLWQRDAESKDDKDQRIFKVSQNEIANYRAYKFIEINTLVQLLKESLALSEKQMEVGKGKDEETGNELELQVLQSAFWYVTNEIYGIGTRREQVREEVQNLDKESQSDREKQMLYKAFRDAEKQIQSIQNAPESPLEKTPLDGLPDQSPYWDTEVNFKQLKLKEHSKHPLERAPETSMSPINMLPKTPFHSINFPDSSLPIDIRKEKETKVDDDIPKIIIKPGICSEQSFLYFDGPLNERKLKSWVSCGPPTFTTYTPNLPNTCTSDPRKFSIDFDQVNSQSHILSVGRDGILSPSGNLSPSKCFSPSWMTYTPRHLISPYTPSGDDISWEFFSRENIKPRRSLEPNLKSLKETVEEGLKDLNSNQESSEEKSNQSWNSERKESSGEEMARFCISPLIEPGHDDKPIFGDEEEGSSSIGEESLLYKKASFLNEKEFSPIENTDKLLPQDILGTKFTLTESQASISSGIVIPIVLEKRTGSTEIKNSELSTPSKRVTTNSSRWMGKPEDKMDMVYKNKILSNLPHNETDWYGNQSDENVENTTESVKQLLNHIDVELEKNPLPSILNHNDRETEIVGNIRNLIENYRRVKKNMVSFSSLFGESTSCNNIIKGTFIKSPTDHMVGNVSLQWPVNEKLSSKLYRSLRNSTVSRTTNPINISVPTIVVPQNCWKRVPNTSKPIKLTFPGSELLQKIPEPQCSQKVQRLVVYAKKSYEKLAQLDYKKRKTRNRLKNAFELLKINLETLRSIPKTWLCKLQQVAKKLEEFIQSVLNTISSFEAAELKEENSRNYVLRLSRIGQILYINQGKFEHWRKKLGKAASTQILQHLRGLELEMVRSLATLQSVGKALQYNGMETSVEMKVLREKFEAAERELVKLETDKSLSPAGLEDSWHFLQLARLLLSTLQKRVPRGGSVLIRTRSTYRVVDEDSESLLEESSRCALQELDEIKYGSSSKLIQIKTMFINLERRIKFLESLSLQFVEKESIEDIKKQLKAVDEETQKIVGTNQSAIENNMGMILTDMELCNPNEGTLSAVIKTKRQLPNIGMLTALDTLLLTLEDIANKISVMEVKEISKIEGLEKPVDILAVGDVVVLQKEIGPLLAPSEVQDHFVLLDKKKQTISNTTNKLTYSQQQLHESSKIMHNQAKDLHDNSEIISSLKERTEKSDKEYAIFRSEHASLKKQMDGLKREYELTKQKYEQNNKNLVQERDKLSLKLAIAEKEIFFLKEKHQNAIEKLRDRLDKQHLKNKTSLIERVSEEMHRLRCLIE